jgi:heterodisulfide reductase subunit C
MFTSSIKDFKVKALASAASARSDESLNLALQLFDALPCTQCGYITTSCRCTTIELKEK